MLITCINHYFQNQIIVANSLKGPVTRTGSYENLVDVV